MLDLAALPTRPGPDDFRALARSSPWLFTSLHFTHRAPGAPPVEASLQRPGYLEVWVDGERHVVRGVPYVRWAMSIAFPPDADTRHHRRPSQNHRRPSRRSR